MGPREFLREVEAVVTMPILSAVHIVSLVMIVIFKVPISACGTAEMQAVSSAAILEMPEMSGRM